MTLPEGITVGAIVALNAVGDVYHPQTGQCIASARMPDGTPVMADGLLYGTSPMPAQMRIPAPGSNTTIGVVATNLELTKAQATKLAQMAQDGLARAIVPAHTTYDGDTAFCLSTAARPLSGAEADDITAIGSLAAEVLAAAVVRAVEAARQAGGCPAARDIEAGRRDSDRK